MIARDLITEDVYPVYPHDPVYQVLDLMSLNRLSELPVLDGEHIIGLVHESDLIDLQEEDPIASVVTKGFVDHVAPIDHLLDIMKVMSLRELTMVPVLNKEGKYRGIITREHLFSVFTKKTAIIEQGAIIQLHIKRNSYSLADLARIIESENGKIIATFLYEGNDAEHLRVILKLATQDIKHIVASLERFGYDIEASFTDREYQNNLMDRYEHLMHYIDV